MKHIRPTGLTPKAIGTQAILDSLYSHPQQRDAGEDDFRFPARAFFLGFVLTLALYYPVVRGYFWLVLAIAYLVGTNPTWPGPYTPYPPQF